MTHLQTMSPDPARDTVLPTQLGLAGAHPPKRQTPGCPVSVLQVTSSPPPLCSLLFNLLPGDNCLGSALPLMHSTAALLFSCLKPFLLIPCLFLCYFHGQI